MFSMLFQYFHILKEIRIAKIQGYKSMVFNIIYPYIQYRLEEKGYKVYLRHNLFTFKREYVVEWG